MTTEFRTVVDTSVAVSAILARHSTPRKAFDLAARVGPLLASEATIEELSDVLQRPKFARYISEQERLEFLAAFIRDAEVVPITHRIIECRDVKDNKFLELAISGRASHIISGDVDLLELSPFRNVSIVRPANFLEIAKGHEQETKDS